MELVRTLNTSCMHVPTLLVYMYTCMQLSHHLCMVLLYDLLLGKGIQCGGTLKRFLTSHKVELLTALKSSTKMHTESIKSTGTCIIISVLKLQLSVHLYCPILNGRSLEVSRPLTRCKKLSFSEKPESDTTSHISLTPAQAITLLAPD